MTLVEDSQSESSNNFLSTKVTVAAAGGFVSPRQFIVVSQVFSNIVIEDKDKDNYNRKEKDKDKNKNKGKMTNLMMIATRQGGKRRHLYWPAEAFNLTALQPLLALSLLRSTPSSTPSPSLSSLSRSIIKMMMMMLIRLENLPDQLQT